MDDAKGFDPEDVEKALVALGLIGMMSELAGSTLVRVGRPGRVQLVSDYSGGSAMSQVTQTLKLHKDLNFWLEEKIFSAITGGGISLPKEERRHANGKWRLVIENDTLFLELKRYGAPLIRWTFEQPSPERVLLEGQSWSCSR